MKKLSLIAICLVGLSSCDKPAKTIVNTVKENNKALGSDKDDHGCVSSAGQAWSQIEQDCIQIFNKGFRLNPIETKEGKEVISAFILFSDDQSKIELFLPKDAGYHNISILNKANNDLYQNDHYKYDSKKSVLYISGVEKYSGNVE